MEGSFLLPHCLQPSNESVVKEGTKVSTTFFRQPTKVATQNTIAKIQKADSLNQILIYGDAYIYIKYI